MRFRFTNYGQQICEIVEREIRDRNSIVLYPSLLAGQRFVSFRSCACGAAGSRQQAAGSRQAGESQRLA